MNRMAPMTAQTLFRMKSEHLQGLLQTSIEQFQKGEDVAGIESLLCAMDEMENAVECDQNMQQPRIDLSLLLLAMKKLYFYIQNQDIAGIVDLLNDTFFPLTEEWLKGCDRA